MAYHKGQSLDHYSLAFFYLFQFLQVPVIVNYGDNIPSLRATETHKCVMQKLRDLSTSFFQWFTNIYTKENNN